MKWFFPLGPFSRLPSRSMTGQDVGLAELPPDEPPLRDELYGIDQLARHALSVAETDRLSTRRSTGKLLARLDENERVLFETYALVSAVATREQRTTPASEWLLDNFYLIEEQIDATRRLLPRSYLRRLPTLASGPAADCPRTYRIALELIAHTDGRVDMAVLDAFLASYQTIAALDIGELWAMPLMLRLALIENLRRVAVRIITTRRHRDLAAGWADRMLEVAETKPNDLILLLADMARAAPPMSEAFLAEFTRTLQGHSPTVGLATSWLEHRLAEQGKVLEQMVLSDGQSQATDQASIGNSIEGLRFLAVQDWREFVSRHSIIEKTLAEDPACVYSEMDFATRNRYRGTVEQLARLAGCTEEEASRAALRCARDAASWGGPGGTIANQRMAHVGYHLIDRGRSELEHVLGIRSTAYAACLSRLRQMRLGVYLTAVLLATLAVTLVFWRACREDGSIPWMVWLVTVPLAVCASQIGVSLVNWCASVLVRPQPLPRLGLASGVPPELRTLVAVPTMLTGPGDIERILEGLEARYVANRGANLHFALLTDLVDAAAEHLPEDAERVRLVSEGIARLNRTYDPEHGEVFMLLHRARTWSGRQGVWMGRERKRGKLADLNATLRGEEGRFATVVGALRVLRDVRYVITLDTDTQLPRDTAKDMIGAMGHILNRPVPAADGGRIEAGYAILQPRVSATLTSAQRSRFGRISGGAVGVDPYTRVVSDLYQDLFGEGSFIGKGIYDVDAFDRWCGGFPRDTVLSHDLLEGCHCRSGLESDVVLYEDQPSSYLVDVSRRHRWIRGDWQISEWLLPRVRSADGQRVDNPLSLLSRWKIFDNLRRSVMPIAMLGLLLLGMFSGRARFLWHAILLVVASLLVPAVLTALTEFLRRPVDRAFGARLFEASRSLGRPVLHGVLSLVFLPSEAAVAADAVLRTLFRMGVSRRHLLEWRTSAEADRAAAVDVLGFVRGMICGPVLAVVVASALLASGRQQVLALALPLLGSWLVGPVVAWWISLPVQSAPPRFSAREEAFLHSVARRTWRYFEEHVTEQTHWLPPDNIQESVQGQGPETVATRTSPTNIAMAMLSDLAACDFGYCSVGRLVARTERTIGTLARLERHRGHLFNWYDTVTLAPLLPQYVSTVDSGNFVGMLLVMARGFDELVDAEIVPVRMNAGLRDTLGMLREVASGDKASTVAERLDRQWQQAVVEEESVREAVARLERIVGLAAELTSEEQCSQECLWWAETFRRDAGGHLDDLHTIAAWTTLAFPPESLWREAGAPGTPAAMELRRALGVLDRRPTLRTIGSLRTTLLPLVGEARATCTGGPAAVVAALQWLDRLEQAIDVSVVAATGRIGAIGHLAATCRTLADIDFRFLYDAKRRLFAIGFNVTDNRVDSGFYDMLASEARLTSFVLIAKQQLEQEHWFALGRLLTSSGGSPALLSWSGSMFEYLMPLLVMPTFDDTLLDRSCKAAVHRHIAYGWRRSVPWGISESGYNARDSEMSYQYRAFGVPGLGLKRGLAGDLVVAPYASALALMVSPRAACRNLERMAAEGYLGSCGFYEAIDYTPSRQPPAVDGVADGKAIGGGVAVRQFMAHHQGMSLVAMAGVLLGRPMQRRFMGDPMLSSMTLLLQERVPRTSAVVYPHALEAGHVRPVPAVQSGAVRVVTDPNGLFPEVHLLSNGRYHVCLTAAGGGWSRWYAIAVTRWREDTTRDCWGQFCYLHDPDTGDVWSSTWQPTVEGGGRYEAVFMHSRVEFRRHEHGIDAHTLVAVSPEDDVELRRLTLTNRSDKPRRIEVTSYAEIALTSQAQDESHPAFTNLFVESEILRSCSAILATRRPRSKDEKQPWMLHMMTAACAHGEDRATVGDASFETDRRAFIGRGRSLCHPQAVDRPELSDRAGSTLDPIAGIRRTVMLPPHGSVRFDIVTGVAASRAESVKLAEKYADPCLTSRVVEMAWTRGAIMLQQLGITERKAQGYARMAGSLVYASGLRRAPAAVIARNTRGPAGLWGHGISGDLPIVLVRIRDRHRLELVREAVEAHGYWQRKGLEVELVIWNEDTSVYRQTLHEAIMDLIRAGPDASFLDKPGGIFVRRGEQLSEEDRLLLQASARVMLTDEAGTLLEQIVKRGRADKLTAVLKLPSRRQGLPVVSESAAPRPETSLTASNGRGGFSEDGSEYLIRLVAGQTTPAPWVNVIANPRIGTVVSESGSAFTWVDNSHEYRLTPWTNDPVSDAGGEAIFIRDEDTGLFWSPTPYPAGGPGGYEVRHGFGSTTFLHREQGIVTDLCVFVAADDPVKLVRVTVTNASGRPRKLSITGYWELVLGELRSRSQMQIVTQRDPLTRAVMARNPHSSDFPDHVAFFDSSDLPDSVTCDRGEFIGRNRSLADPAALGRTELSGRIGAGWDPCVALQLRVDLDVGETRTVVFTCGAAENLAAARQLVVRYRGVERARPVFNQMHDEWRRRLGSVRVETPDPAVDALVNGWLLYQTLSCRMWARTAFYQSGGAYGFRDQLQDAMALVHAAPELLREHLLRAAGRQFKEGDVQHWWHPPSGRGVRTRCSDDLLWLPLAVSRYVEATGDTGVLDELVPFLQARDLRADEEAAYDRPVTTDELGTVYEHCRRAIEKALRFGDHGLPLMEGGDWNDGMNLVGVEGRGESVWLAFFLFHVLQRFSSVAERQGDVATADRCVIAAGRLRANIEEHAWDGEWYLRAWFDDGTPLGSVHASSCRIDSIPQSWSVLSGAASHARATMAMDSVDRLLVSDDDRLIRLLSPPFDDSTDPGYIRGYAPGVRENGGQYTHAAIWAAMAFAALGDHRRAWELFGLINPVAHGTTPEESAVYRVEPYVVAADVYGVAPHVGRGGWSWYTGSAAWMYRLLVESLLGLERRGSTLHVTPHLPGSWGHATIHYRYLDTTYRITVRQVGGEAAEGPVTSVTLDGVATPEPVIELVNDRLEHVMAIEIGGLVVDASQR